MDADQPHDFNERLSHWIANQGFWFQLRYSMSGGGGWSVAIFHLLRLAFRLAILMVVAAVGFGIYLAKRVETPSFKDGLERRFGETLAATEARMTGFRRSGGRANVRRVGAIGGDKAFFRSLDAGNLSFKMGLLDGLSRQWDAENVEIGWLDLELKGGANSAKDAAAAAAAVFEQHPSFLIQGIEVADTRISWGSQTRVRITDPLPSYGEIEGSRMAVSRTGSGWRLAFTGGTFSQNWLRDFAIEELVIVLSPSGLSVEKGELTDGDCRISFKDVRVTGGEFPAFSGTLALSKLPIERVVPDRFAELINGTISTELEIGGSSNSQEGIHFKGKVTLSDGDTITVRSQLPLLEALDHVDVFHSYQRVVFNAGEFEMETGGGALRVTGIDLDARDLMTIQGRLEARNPTEDEVARDVGSSAAAMSQPLFMPENPTQDRGVGISLKQAGRAAASAEEEDEDANKFFADMAAGRQLRREAEMQRQHHEALDRARGMLRFDGGVRMFIPGDAFERSRELRERYPIEQETGRIGLDVVFRGTLPELTLEQAQEVLRLDQMRD